LKNAQNPLLAAPERAHSVDQITFPGGDLSIVTNFEYRITIYGPVALAPFMDAGIDPILRPSQLENRAGAIRSGDWPAIWMSRTGSSHGHRGRHRLHSRHLLESSAETAAASLGIDNWKPRMSTGLELQMFLPVINAPFRIYWAYNPLRLDNPAIPPIPITRAMFPNTAAGDYTYHLAVNTYAPPSCCASPAKPSASPWPRRSNLV